MVLDRRGGWLVQARYYLSATAYPLQLAVNSPSQGAALDPGQPHRPRDLQAQNAALRARDRELSLKVMRFEALARENAELRGLRASLPPIADHWLAAEVIDSSLKGQGQRQRLLINRGARNGVFKGQAVMDNYGLLGQTTRVGPWSAEVILITDLEHAVPVEVERTGVHTIAEGTNDADFLALPYLPANADLRAGDLLADLRPRRSLPARLSGCACRGGSPTTRRRRRSSWPRPWHTWMRCTKLPWCGSRMPTRPRRFT